MHLRGTYSLSTRFLSSLSKFLGVSKLPVNLLSEATFTSADVDTLLLLDDARSPFPYLEYLLTSCIFYLRPLMLDLLSADRSLFLFIYLFPLTTGKLVYHIFSTECEVATICERGPALTALPFGDEY